MKTYQPRYIAYCKSNNRKPEEQLNHDSEQYPGGKMAGYIIWIGEMWHKWSKETNEKPEWAGSWSNQQHKKFDKWLKEKF